MSGEQFEGYLADVFRSVGFIVHGTKRSGDQGADLEVSRNGRRGIVQAKQWSSPRSRRRSHYAAIFSIFTLMNFNSNSIGLT